MDAIRERLAALYGERAVLMLASRESDTEARLELPFESDAAVTRLSTSGTETGAQFRSASRPVARV